MSTKTRTDYRDAILQALAEAANSALPALPSGSGSNGYAIDPGDGMYTLINEAKDEYCKRAALIERTGTASIAAGAAPAYALASFADAGTKTILTASELFFDPDGATAKYRLTKISPEAMHNFYRDRTVAANAALRYWSHKQNDPRIVETHVRSNAAGVLSGVFYGIPIDLGDDDDTFGWLPSDDDDAVILYAALKLTEKRTDDPRLPAKRAFLAPRYDKVMLGIRGRISPNLQRDYLEPYAPYSINIPTAEAV